MKVVLLEDVKKVGKKGEIVELSEAYARNVIIKKGLGLEGTATNLNNAKQQQESKEFHTAQATDEAKVLAKQLEKVEVTIPVKMGENGKVFGFITYKVELDKKKLDIKEAIKTLGTHDVIVRVHPSITSTIKVHVVEGK